MYIWVVIILPTWKIYVSKLSILSMMPYFVMWNNSFTKIFTLLNNVSKTNSRCNHVFYQVYIKQFTSHTTGCYTGKIIAKLSIWIKHFRDNQLLSESFPGENHFLVSCVHPAVTCYICRLWLEWFLCSIVTGLYYFACLSRLTVRHTFRV